MKVVDEHGAPVMAAFISSKDLTDADDWYCKEDQKCDSRDNKILGSHAVGLEIAWDLVEERRSVIDETLRREVQLFGRIGVRWNVEDLSRSARVHLCKCEAIQKLGENPAEFKVIDVDDDTEV